MIATPEKLEEIASLPEGRLDEIPYPLLLAALYRQRRSGQLELVRPPIEKRIVFEDGCPVDCRSNLAHETFGRYLVSVGKLAADAMTSALSAALSREVLLGEVLLERRLLDPTELYRQLQQNLARKLLDLFTWREGSFRLLLESPAAASSLRVRAPQLILTGVTKLLPLELARTALDPLGDAPLALHPERAALLEELRLAGRHRQLIDALARPQALHELLLSTNLSPPEVVRLVYALGLLEVVTLESSLPRSRTPPPVAKPPAPQAPTPRRANLPFEELRNRVLEDFLSFRRKDSLDLLGLAEEASAVDLQQAYLALAERSAPWQLPAEASDDLVEKARAVFLAAGEAYGELRDPERRGALLFRRKTLREERSRHDAGEPLIRTDLLDSAKQFTKGMAQLEGGRPAQAHELLGFAADCDPQNALYRAEAARARWLAWPAQLQPAIDELEEAVRLDASCGIAHLYLGELCGEASRFDDAELHLRRAAKLMAPDRRAIEILRSLSGKRKR